MNVELVPIVGAKGIYGPRKDTLPARLAWLHPDAAEAFKAIAPHVRVSDMFRSPASSLRALQAGRAAAAPGLSSHNYGRAIDIDVGPALSDLGMTKAQLDAWMLERGWACWRDDHKLARESWHYYHASSPVTYSRGNAVAWWGAEMKRLYPCKGSRAAAYVAWFKASGRAD